MLSPIVEPRPVPARSADADRCATFVSHVTGLPLVVTRHGERLTVCSPGGAERSGWTVRDGNELRLEWNGPCAGEPSEPHLLAALDATMAMHPAHAELALASPLPRPTQLIQSGTVVLQASERPRVMREALWQHPGLWLPAGAVLSPLQYTLTQGRRHPRRPPKPTGTVYRRYIPWLGQTLSLRAIDAERDLSTFNRWMNDPVVARFWQEQGDAARHRAYLEAIAADPHTVALVGCFDDEPFGYFEIYWAKEDRIAPFCDADDFDRGWHVLVGEPKFRGRPYLTAWMPSVSHYLFLADCRTQRIVIEPRSDNAKMLRSLARCGYALLKEFDFPHKRAVLGMLLRERFFGEALWIPRPDTPQDA